jgi:hypothetical protein
VTDQERRIIEGLAGCLCPIVDNGRGKRPGPWGWVVNGECPVHATGFNPTCEPTPEIQVSGPNLEEQR